MAEWKHDSGYTPDQVAATVKSLGIELVAETYSDFLCYCPFHANHRSPAFTVGKENGLWICHNAACEGNRGGSLVHLVMRMSDRNDMESLRLILKKGNETRRPLSEKIDAMMAKQEMPIVPQMKVDEFVENFWSHRPAMDYMYGRGFTDETLREFDVGFDLDKQMVVVPIHHDGNVIGLNGRSIEGKQFKLSRKMPRNKVLFNLDRAKRSGGTVIFCESQFDVMRIHQAGFPNAVCSFGSHVSKEQGAMLQRYFERLIIMTDADEAGRKSGHTLSSMVQPMKVEWAVWDWGVVYPRDCKDAGDMTDEEISFCVRNAVSDLEYKTFPSLVQ